MSENQENTFNKKITVSRICSNMASQKKTHGTHLNQAAFFDLFHRGELFTLSYQPPILFSDEALLTCKEIHLCVYKRNEYMTTTGK